MMVLHFVLSTMIPFKLLRWSATYALILFYFFFERISSCRRQNFGTPSRVRCLRCHRSRANDRRSVLIFSTITSRVCARQRYLYFSLADLLYLLPILFARLAQWLIQLFLSHSSRGTYSRLAHSPTAINHSRRVVRA